MRIIFISLIGLFVIFLIGCEKPNSKYITLKVTDVWLARKEVLEEDKLSYTIEWGDFRHKVPKDGKRINTWEDMSSVDYIQFVDDSYYFGRKDYRTGIL